MSTSKAEKTRRTALDTFLMARAVASVTGVSQNSPCRHMTQSGLPEPLRFNGPGSVRVWKNEYETSQPSGKRS